MKRPIGKRATPRPQPSARSPLPRYIWNFLNRALQGVTNFTRALDWIHALKGGESLSSSTPVLPPTTLQYVRLAGAATRSTTIWSVSVLFLLSVDVLIYTPHKKAVDYNTLASRNNPKFDRPRPSLVVSPSCSTAPASGHALR